MLGAIIGDIVGSRFEFNNIHTKDFELFTKECSYTDDTICTVAIADAILQDIPFDASLQKWCRRYANPMGGYGAHFKQWVFSDNPQPYNSYGNGSAMRVSPVAWAYNDGDTIIAKAVASAACTHNHSEGLKGAKYIAGIIAVHLNRPVPFMGNLYKTRLTLDAIRRHNRFNETCQGTIPYARRCWEEACDFEDAIRNAVSIGGDTDTIAAIVGSVAEVRFGLPAYLANEALSYLPQEMVDVVIAFYNKYGHKNLRTHCINIPRGEDSEKRSNLWYEDIYIR